MTDIPTLITTLKTEYPELSKQADEILKIYVDHIELTNELRKAFSESISSYRNAQEFINTLTSRCERYELIIDKLLQDD